MRCFIPWLFLLAVFIPLTVTSTPPSMWLRAYRLRGTLVDSGGAPIAGATVAFAARCSNGYVVLIQPNGCDCNQGKLAGTPAARTGDNGTFSIDLVSCEDFDSLVVAVVEPDTVMTGGVLAVKNSHPEPLTETYPSEKSYFFCATSTGYTTVRIGVVYSFSSQTVTMPQTR